MATSLDDLDDRLENLKARYSAIIDESYDYSASIAAIAVNMQTQLDAAEEAASRAGESAINAQASANNAATAGAEAGATAGASEAQTKYDAIFEQAHTWQASQTITGDLTASATVHAQDLDVSNQVKASNLMVGQNAYSITAGVGSNNENMPILYIDTPKNSGAILDCYSASLQHCVVEQGITANTIDAATISTSTVEATTISLPYSYSNTNSNVTFKIAAVSGDIVPMRIEASADNKLYLLCYSAALQSCSVANTLYIGTLQIGDDSVNASLTAAELVQLKALINQ